MTTNSVDAVVRDLESAQSKLMAALEGISDRGARAGRVDCSGGLRPRYRNAAHVDRQNIPDVDKSRDRPNTGGGGKAHG